jgi:hypothetical protein
MYTKKYNQFYMNDNFHESFEKMKEKNKRAYNMISKEYNQLYIGKESDFTKEDIKVFDDTIFDGNLINECGILQIVEHGEYNDIDQLKHTISRKSRTKSPKSHYPLPVPVIFLSGRIGYSSFMMPDEQIEDSVPIIDELKYNSLLTPLNHKKQVQKIAHELRLLHKHYLQVQIDEITEIIKQQTGEVVEENKNIIKQLKREMKMIYGFFNPYHFKKGETIQKYLTFMEGKNAPEYGRTRGIFDINGNDHFQSYVDDNKSLKQMNGDIKHTIINLGDLIHYMYLNMDRIPKYFFVIDHSCSNLGIELRETLNENKYAKNFYNKHLNVQKRSFSFSKKKRTKIRSI